MYPKVIKSKKYKWITPSFILYIKSKYNKDILMMKRKVVVILKVFFPLVIILLLNSFKKAKRIPKRKETKNDNNWISFCII